MLAAKVSGTTTYAGTHTIRLDKAVSVPKGTYYAVVVNLQKSGAGLDMEYAVSDSSLTSRVYCDYNQSFLYRYGSWEDVADVSTSYGGRIGNICIKAYADNAGTSIGAVKNIKAVRSAKMRYAFPGAKRQVRKGMKFIRHPARMEPIKRLQQRHPQIIKLRQLQISRYIIKYALIRQRKAFGSAENFPDLSL